jgi:hypothetical protein
MSTNCDDVTDTYADELATTDAGPCQHCYKAYMPTCGNFTATPPACSCACHLGSPATTAMWSTKLSSEAVKEEATKIGLAWHRIQGVEVHPFDNGSMIVVALDGADARKLVDHLVTLGMAEPT